MSSSAETSSDDTRLHFFNALVALQDAGSIADLSFSTTHDGARWVCSLALRVLPGNAWLNAEGASVVSWVDAANNTCANMHGAVMDLLTALAPRTRT